MQMDARGDAGLVGWLRGLLSRRTGARAAREMEVLEMLTLGPGKQLVLVRVGVARYVVGTGADSVDAIVRVDDVGGVSA